MHFNASVSEWHLMIIGSQRMAVVDIFRDILVVMPNDGEHRAREILATSLHAGLQHVAGIAKSGFLLTRGRLAYGNDEVMRRFVTACRVRELPTRISGADGRAIVRLQHDVIDRA
jgi:hypothetical protein